MKFCPNNDVFLSLKVVVTLANSADLDKIMLYFTWVFTICQSTFLRVTSIKRVNM